jgi:hypothetical protein
MAVAACHGVDVVLTWNVAHIATRSFVGVSRTSAERLGTTHPFCARRTN